MSILIEYENGSLKTAALVSQRTTPSPSYLCEDGRTFCVGDIFDVTFEELSKKGWQTAPTVLNEILGTKGIAQANKNGCSFAVDMTGLDTFYYYFNESRFILSDNFWNIVKRLEPTYEDLDILYLHNHLICRPTSGNTFIKNLCILQYNQIGTYDAVKNALTIRRYQEFRYRKEITNIAEAADRMDALLHEAMEKIHNKCGDVMFGVGLSGGMDSRLLPHYAKAHGLRLTSFNTCIARPHKLLLAQSVARAQKLAQIFGIPFYPVCWKEDSLKEKIDLVTKNYPLDMGGSAFKYEAESRPEFDVLFTGSIGMAIGSSLPPNLPQYSESALVDMMARFYFPSLTATFSNRASRAISYLLGKEPKVGDSRRGALMTLLLTDEDYEFAKKDLAVFVAEGKKLGKSNIDIYQEYHINQCGSMARNGAHESAIATKRSFFIYVPFILQETLSWDPVLLEKRVVLGELIRRHIPEVVNVKGETFSAAAKDQKTGLLSKVLSLSEFLLRGNGTAIDQYAFRQHHIRKRFIDEMNQNRDSWFHRAMGICDTEITEKMVRNDSARTAIRIWQLKDTIDCIEHKEYLSF